MRSVNESFKLSPTSNNTNKHIPCRTLPLTPGETSSFQTIKMPVSLCCGSIEPEDSTAPRKPPPSPIRGFVPNQLPSNAYVVPNLPEE